MKTVAVIVGSLRRESINRKLAQAVIRLAAGRLDMRLVEIGDLPLYNEDLWESPPGAVLRMKREVEAADGVLFVTPEYNRSFTPAIKNVVDWGTRPWGRNSWAAKPAAIIGASPGAIGSAVAQNALKSVLSAADTVLMGQPEVYLAYKPEMFDAAHEIVDAKTRGFLDGWVTRFAAWIERTHEPKVRAQPDAG